MNKRVLYLSMFIFTCLMLSYAVDPNYPYLDRQEPVREAPVEKPPMLVLLSSDDNYNLEGMEWMIDAISSRKHADSTSLRMSFYCNSEFWSGIGKDELFNAFNIAYKLGNEVTSHTARHIKCSAPPGDPKRLSDDSIYNDIQDNLNTLEEIGILKEHMYGFRTPYIATTDSTFIAVKRSGFMYDASVYEGIGDKPGEYRWPYTIDTKNDFLLDNNGLELPPEWWDEAVSGPKPEPIEPSYAPGNHFSIAYNNYTNRAPIRRHSGLWELPIYCFTAPDSLIPYADTAFGYSTSGYIGGTIEDLIMGDTTGNKPKLAQGAAFTKERALATLKHHFDKVYNGNRAPMTLVYHTPNFSPTTGKDEYFPRCSNAIDRQWIIEQFIDYALGKEEVWFVSGEQAIKYCRNPVSVDQFNPNDFTDIPITPVANTNDFSNLKKAKDVKINKLKKNLLELDIRKSGIYEVSIYSINGKELVSIKKDINRGLYKIPLNKMSAGAVIVKVSNSSNKFISKVTLLNN